MRIVESAQMARNAPNVGLSSRENVLCVQMNSVITSAIMNAYKNVEI